MAHLQTPVSLFIELSRLESCDVILIFLEGALFGVMPRLLQSEIMCVSHAPGLLCRHKQARLFALLLSSSGKSMANCAIVMVVSGKPPVMRERGMAKKLRAPFFSLRLLLARRCMLH